MCSLVLLHTTPFTPGVSVVLQLRRWVWRGQLVPGGGISSYPSRPFLLSNKELRRQNYTARILRGDKKRRERRAVFILSLSSLCGGDNSGSSSLHSLNAPDCSFAALARPLSIVKLILLSARRPLEFHAAPVIFTPSSLKES